MTSTQVAVVYRDDGEIAMVVIPDDDKQLDDPAFSPKGHVQVRIEKARYEKDSKDIPSLHALMKETQPDLAAKDAVLGEKIRQIVETKDAEIAAEKEAAEAVEVKP